MGGDFRSALGLLPDYVLPLSWGRKTDRFHIDPGTFWRSSERKLRRRHCCRRLAEPKQRCGPVFSRGNQRRRNFDRARARSLLVRRWAPAPPLLQLQFNSRNHFSTSRNPSDPRPSRSGMARGHASGAASAAARSGLYKPHHIADLYQHNPDSGTRSPRHYLNKNNVA